MSREDVPLGADAIHNGRSSRYVAAFAILLALSMAVSTMAVPTLGVLSRFLLDEFAISRAQLGWLIASASIFAGVLSPTAGKLSDRLGGRRMILMLLAMGSVVMLGLAAASTFLLLVGVSIFAGMMNSIGNPATNRMIASTLPIGKRGLVMGIKQSGVPAGIFLAGVALPPVALAFGWRTAVAIASVVPFVVLLSARAILPREERTDNTSRSVEVAHDQEGTVTWIVVYAFLMGVGDATVISFLPLYLQESLHWDVTIAGAALAGIGVLGMGARVFWSRWAEHHGQLPMTLLLMAAASFGAALAFWAAGLTTDTLIWVGVALVGAVSVAWNAVAYLFAISAFEGQRAGRSSGFVMFGFMAGMTIGPIGFGYTVDLTGRYDLAWILVLSASALAMLQVGIFQRGR